jgi:hypothetical protein
MKKHSSEEGTAVLKARSFKSFTAGALFSALSIAIFLLQTPSSSEDTPEPYVESTSEISPNQSSPVELPNERTAPTLSLDRIASLAELERCARKAVQLSPAIPEPTDGATLVAPNFPAALGFGPLSVHIPLPGSAFVHVLRSTSPLPVAGAVDIYAAPMVVDTELTYKLGTDHLAVGISSPYRGILPSQWLTTYSGELTTCLIASTSSPALTIP